MSLPTGADVDAAVAAGGSPRPKTALLNALLKAILEYLGTVGAGGAGAWGSITGTLSAQADIVAALAAKAASVHTHVRASITDLGSAAGRNIPATGNAAANEVVLGADTRLSDPRAPTSHGHAKGDVDGLVGALAVLAVDDPSGHVEAPAVKAYVLVEKARFAFTIDSLARRCGSGSCTLKVQVGGADVPGLTSLAADSTQREAAASSGNAVAVGQRVTLVVTANSSAADLVWTMQRTRVLPTADVFEDGVFA